MCAGGESGRGDAAILRAQVGVKAGGDQYAAHAGQSKVACA